jgi:phosphoribosylanthranilate isomerase
MKVKICGVTRFDDALACAQVGADMIGLNFYRQSPRYIEPDAAREICDGLRTVLGARAPLFIGVFVNENVSRISETMEKVGLNFVQLSGDESGEMITELRGLAFKTIRPQSKPEALNDADYYMRYAPADERIPSMLLDAHHASLYGGTGEQASLDVALAIKDVTPRLMLAGGLTPDNVAWKTRWVHPWGVDVASGVEVDGDPRRKDISKVRSFVQAVHVSLA